MINSWLNRWNNVSGADRLEVVFSYRFKEYGAYQIRQQYNRNAAIGMLMAPLILTGIFAGFMYRNNDIQNVVLKNIVECPISIETLSKYFEPSKGHSQKSAGSESQGNEAGNPTWGDEIPPSNGANFKGSCLGCDFGDVHGTSNETIGFDTGSMAIGSTKAKSKPNRNATFIGGDEKFIEYIKSQFLTTDFASLPREIMIEIRFLVNEKGYLTQVSMVKEDLMSKEFAAEAIRVISNSPRWIPAFVNGKYTSAWRQIPIRLILD